MQKPLIKLLFFSLFIFGIKSNISSQTESNFKNKSFVIIESKNPLTEAEVKKVDEHDFDQYRFYTLRKKVQLERGPLIELLSVQELEQKGFVFSKTYVDMIKTKSETFKHESILKLNLGLGIYPAYEPK